MTRRWTAFLLAAVFALTMWTAAAADEPKAPETAEAGEAMPEDYPDEMKLAYDNVIRFGAGTSVERDGNGEVISVEGHGYRQVETYFYVRGVEEKIDATTDFVDYPFFRSAAAYDGNLAVMSLFLALTSARDKVAGETGETLKTAQNVEEYLLGAGFTDIRKDDYSKETSIYTISTAMGSRVMESEGEEPFTLIAVGVCGGDYKNEWQSNMTAGLGDEHAGFRSASDLVIDRVAGYIATRGIKGRIKLWISGFSRAAAVANLTAAKLTDTGTLAKDDVYCYTFATPAAVLNPPKEGHENIYNILCPTDAVPQVMPADWNYGRYGTDLYLPSPEFSTEGESVMYERQLFIEAAFGIEINYSEALNLRMRMLISMAFEAIGSRDNYVKTLQDTAVNILQNKNASNLLGTMRNLLLGFKESGAVTQEKTDRLINYLVRVFGNAMTRTELAKVNRNTGSSLLLLFTEHREDSYLGNMSVMRSGMYEEGQVFRYVFVKGPAELELTVDEIRDWHMVLDEKGNVIVGSTTPGSEPDTNPDYRIYYLERIGDVSIAAIPTDYAVHLNWKAVKDGTVEVRQAECGLRVSVNYPGATTGPIKVKAGDTGTAYDADQRDGVLPEGFRAATYNAADLTDFLGISLPVVSWRVLATLVLLLIGLMIFLVLRVIALLLPSRAKHGAAAWMLLALFCVAATEAEGAYWLLADMTWVRFIWKAVAGASVLCIYYLRQKKGKTPDGLLPGLIAVIAADLVITWSFIPGVVLYAIGHILLIISFLKKKAISGGMWAQWAVIAALVTALIIFVFVPRVGTNAWAAAAYAPVLLLMVYAVSGQGTRIRYAATSFLVSDLLLGIYFAGWREPLAHILYMALFSISLLMFALGERKEKAEKAAPAPAAVSVPEN